MSRPTRIRPQTPSRRAKVIPIGLGPVKIHVTLSEHMGRVFPYLWMAMLLLIDFMIAPGIVPQNTRTTAVITGALALLHLASAITVGLRARHAVGWLDWPLHYRWVVFWWLIAEAVLWTQATWVWLWVPRLTPFWSQIGPRLFFLQIMVWMIYRTMIVAETGSDENGHKDTAVAVAEAAAAGPDRGA